MSLECGLSAAFLPLVTTEVIGSSSPKADSLLLRIERGENPSSNAANE
jgi:hypothetical protein